MVVLIKEYEETIADEKARNTILEEQIRELKEQNKVLEEKNRELEAQCKQTSKNSSKPPSTDVFIKPKSQRKKG
ncbi:MAG: DUF6444 domain-containing protein, partial [Methanoregula sp.]|nr:DUF6444 domain-containing protein [Methanoregula sp.]